MGSSASNRLTALQREFLAVFAERTSAYFLTGGAVLAGWILGHRRERVPQLHAKEMRDGLAMDSAAEIVANKICTLLGRAEIRDLVDLYCLERAGFPVERFLEDARQKDAGVTPATLAWLLSEFPIPEDLPGQIDAAALRAYARDLETRMRRLALPDRA